MAFTQIDPTKLAQWIKENPGKKYKVNGVEQVAPESGISKLLATLTQPLRAIPASLYGAITGKEDNPFLSQQESQNLYSNPETFALKNAAGLASFGIPGGAGTATSTIGKIGTATARGATAGALGGYGYSEKGKELSGALTGGLAGGAIGGGLQGLQEILNPIINKSRGITTGTTKTNKMKEIGQNLQSPVGRPSATKNGINTYGKSQNIAKTMEQTIKDNLPIIDEINPTLAKKFRSGFISQTEKTVLYEDIANAAAEKAGLMREASSQATDIASLSKKIAGDEMMTPTMKKALRKSGFFEDLNLVGKASDLGTGKITNVANKGQLHDLLTSIDDSINYARNINSPQPALEKALKVARKNVANEIATGLGTEYSKYNNIYSSFSRAKDTGHLARISNDELARTFGQGGGMDIPIVSDILQSQPVKQLQGQVRNKAGRVMEQLSDIGSQSTGAGIAPESLQGLQKAIGIGQRTTPLAGGLTGNMVSQSQDTQMTAQPTTQSDAGVSQLNMMLAQEVLKGNLSAAEANAVLSLLGQSTSTTKKTDLQKKAESALTSIDKIDSLLQANGDTMLINQLLPFQGGNSEAQIYNSAATDIMDTLARLRTGAVINDAEEKMYRGYIPKITDTPERRTYKLQLLRQVFGSMANATPTTTTTTTVQ